MIITGTRDNTYRDLLQKSPELHDVCQLVKFIAPFWNELGRELRVSYNKRGTLMGNVFLSDRDSLEEVLRHWIENESSPVTWERILRALVNLGSRNMVREVIQYLETPQTYSKYIATMDFISFQGIIIIYKLSMNNL